MTADDYGLLENAAGQTDQRIRYSEPLELGARAAVRGRIQQIRERMVRIDVPFFDEYPGLDAAYPEFEITEAGLRLLEARNA